MEMSKQHRNTKILRFLPIVLVGLIALSVFVPVVWVFLASLKDKSEFYSNPRKNE